jgi:hypothetical protein
MAVVPVADSVCKSEFEFHGRSCLARLSVSDARKRLDAPASKVNRNRRRSSLRRSSARLLEPSAIKSRSLRLKQYGGGFVRSGRVCFGFRGTIAASMRPTQVHQSRPPGLWSGATVAELHFVGPSEARASAAPRAASCPIGLPAKSWLGLRSIPLTRNEVRTGRCILNCGLAAKGQSSSAGWVR